MQGVHQFELLVHLKEGDDGGGGGQHAGSEQPDHDHVRAGEVEAGDGVGRQQADCERQDGGDGGQHGGVYHVAGDGQCAEDVLKTCEGQAARNVGQRYGEQFLARCERGKKDVVDRQQDHGQEENDCKGEKRCAQQALEVELSIHKKTVARAVTVVPRRGARSHSQGHPRSGR